MTASIVNDWKAINDRLKEIRAERSPRHRPCPMCKDRGWRIEALGYRRDTYRICEGCNNPKDLPPPVR